MKNTYDSLDFWRGEVAYIEHIATYDQYGNFNNGKECFKRYCEMQAHTADKHGFHSHAEEIRRIIKAL